eukprot:2277045-Amphidinium_carterae.1
MTDINTTYYIGVTSTILRWYIDGLSLTTHKGRPRVSAERDVTSYPCSHSDTSPFTAIHHHHC